MTVSQLPTAARHSQKDEHWIPLSDLMTGLMMIFMLVAIAFMIQVEAQAQKVKNVAILYDEMRNQLYHDLEKEFEADLPEWEATLSRDLSIRFEEPEVLFQTGESIVTAKFQTILKEFFPRYVKILASDKYRESIEEVRIEGHTSSVWAAWSTDDDAYFRNMKLSQDRTRSTLEWVLLFPDPNIERAKTWLRSRLTANGLSSSRIITNSDGTENRAASQRVEFRVRTNAEEKIGQILQTIQQ